MAKKKRKQQKASPAVPQRATPTEASFYALQAHLTLDGSDIALMLAPLVISVSVVPPTVQSDLVAIALTVPVLLLVCLQASFAARQKVRTGELLTYVVSLFLLFALYARLDTWIVPLCFLAVVGTAKLVFRWREGNALWREVFAILLLSSLLPLLGVSLRVPLIALTQPLVFYQSVVLGLVPGCLLAAAEVMSRATTLEAQGWTRSKLVQTKSGEKRRPAGLSHVIGLLMVLVPAVPTVCSPLGWFPGSFALLAFILFFSASLAQSFMRNEVVDVELARRAKRLAIFANGIMLVAGAAAGC